MDETRIFGIHPQMLQYRARRTEVLASNIANVDTPNYKSRDLTFEAVMNELDNTASIETQTMYRIPVQRSRDGNTVEIHAEQAKFAENTMRYNQSMQFFKSKIKGLQSAIEGR
ncbi:flagellar basal body rod protein FlgB [Vibrio mediterranei]|uniref:flagellar basal body rod protein FlgB n=1 Tax=Vibrio mediterranei TaxID=689 RepID=UPI004067DFF2